MLETQEILTLIKYGNPRLRTKVKSRTKNELVYAWGDRDRQVPWESESHEAPLKHSDVDFEVIEEGNQLVPRPVIGTGEDLSPDVESTAEEFAEEWIGRVVSTYGGLFEESDFPELEFKVLLLWSPKWDSNMGNLVTCGDSMKGKRIADLLGVTHNTVRGKKGSIRDRVETARRTVSLARGEPFL